MRIDGERRGFVSVEARSFRDVGDLEGDQQSRMRDGGVVVVNDRKVSRLPAGYYSPHCCRRWRQATGPTNPMHYLNLQQTGTTKTITYPAEQDMGVGGEVGGRRGNAYGLQP